MLVFKENMKNSLELFKESLNRCEFLSFDCEMTGVTYDLKTDGTKYDNHQFRYFKCKEIAKKFDLIQVGVTFYIRDQIENNTIPNSSSNINLKEGNLKTVEIPLNALEKFKPIYLERTFTFFLFKNSKLRYISENVYSDQSEFSVFSSFTTCHPASLKFLNENNFDLNNLIANGIHYNKLANTQKIKDVVNKYIEEGKIANSVIYLSRVNEEKIVQTLKKITEFLLFGKEEHNMSVDTNSQKNKKIKNNNNLNTKILKIENLNCLIINYLVSTNLKKFLKIQGFNLLKDKSDKTNSTLIVEKSRSYLKSEDFLSEYQSYENFCKILTMDLIFKTRYSHSLLDKNAINLNDIIEEELGFSKFIELIIQKNQINPVPIVGHNLYFDLLFIYEKFIGDLPHNFYDYKMSLHKNFPIIYDNKFLTTRLAKEYDNTKLEALYKKMKKNKLDVYVDINQDLLNGFSFYHDIDSNSCFHDAGYDSIITGRCFIYLLKALENFFEVENKKGSSHQIGKEELKNREGLEIQRGYINFSMMNRMLKNYENKTILSLIEDPFDLCELDTDNESLESFLKFEANLINSFYQNVYVVGIYKLCHKFDLHSIYEFAKLFENDHFNLSVIKIDDHAAFVEFLNDHSISKEKQKELIEKIIQNAMEIHKEVITYVVEYSEFSGNNRKYISI